MTVSYIFVRLKAILIQTSVIQNLPGIRREKMELEKKWNLSFLNALVYLDILTESSNIRYPGWLFKVPKKSG